LENQKWVFRFAPVSYTPKKNISCAGKMEDSLYLAMLAQWLFARWANIFASMAKIFAGTAQYLPAWLNISRHSTIFASMANILAKIIEFPFLFFGIINIHHNLMYFTFCNFDFSSKSAQKDEHHVVGLQSLSLTAKNCSLVAWTFIANVNEIHQCLLHYSMTNIFVPMTNCISKTIGWIADGHRSCLST
jgi:hypothetical protein